MRSITFKKAIFIAFFTLFLIVAITAFAIGFFIDRTQIKSQLITQLHRATGKTIAIDGDINWKFTTHLIVTADRVRITNDHGESLAQIDRIECSPALLPLFKHQIVLNTVALDHALLNLTIENGQLTNWSPTTIDEKNNSDQGFRINRLSLNNCNISVRDQLRNHFYELQNVSFNGPVAVLQDDPSHPNNIAQRIKLEGDIASHSLTIDHLVATDVRAHLVSDQGTVKVQPFTAHLYQGKIASQFEFDFSHPATHFNSNNALTFIDTAALLSDLGMSNRVRGTMQANISINTDNVAALPRSLDGHASVMITRGEVTGNQLGDSLRKSLSYTHKMKSPMEIADFQSFFANTSTTNFDLVSASAEIHNGLASTDNVRFLSDSLRIFGQGSANLITRQLQLSLVAKVVGVDESARIAELQNLLGGEFPLLVSGDFSDLKCVPNYAAMSTTLVKTLFKSQANNLQNSFITRHLNNLIQHIGN